MRKRGFLWLFILSLSATLVARLFGADSGIEYKYTWLTFSVTSRIFLPLQAWFWTMIPILFFQSIIHMKNAMFLRLHRSLYPYVIQIVFIYVVTLALVMIGADLLLLGAWRWKAAVLSVVSGVVMVLWVLRDIPEKWAMLLHFVVCLAVLRFL